MRIILAFGVGACKEVYWTGTSVTLSGACNGTRPVPRSQGTDGAF